MIPKSGCRFSDKIMRKQRNGAMSGKVETGFPQDFAQACIVTKKKK
jgi:hypothetical protein